MGVITTATEKIAASNLQLQDYMTAALNQQATVAWKWIVKSF